MEEYLHLATVKEAQQIDKLFCNSESLGNYSISYHPMNGYNWKKKEKPYENPDGSPVIAHIGLRIYKHEECGISSSVYSEDLK